MVKVLVKKLAPEVQLPNYKTSGASGVDLMAFINEPIKLLPNNSCLVPTGLSVAFSEKYELQIRPRSGLAAKSHITVLNTPGTIDSDYRGEIKVIIYNHGNNDGVAAGRTIHHFHWHIIPRYNGDVENPRGGIRYIISGKGNYSD